MSLKEDYKDLMKKYNISSTSFYLRKKKAKTDEELVEALEKYRSMCITREKRKLDKEIRNEGKKENTPFNLLSRAEYNAYLHKCLVPAISKAKGKYISLRNNCLYEFDDLMQEMMYHLLRPTRERDLIEYTDYLVSYETGERILYAKRTNGRIVKENGVTRVINDKHYIVEPTIEEKKKRVELLSNWWYEENDTKAIINEETGKPYKVPGVDLYEKYLKNPGSIRDMSNMLNFAVNNYLKDLISRSSNQTPTISWDEPIGGNTEDITIADTFKTYDRDNLSIKELIEKCRGITYRNIDIGNLMQELVDNDEKLTTLCRKYNLQVKKVREILEDVRIREILGFE